VHAPETLSLGYWCRLRKMWNIDLKSVYGRVTGGLILKQASAGCKTAFIRLCVR